MVGDTDGFDLSCKKMQTRAKLGHGDGWRHKRYNPLARLFLALVGEGFDCKNLIWKTIHTRVKVSKCGGGERHKRVRDNHLLCCKYTGCF